MLLSRLFHSPLLLQPRRFLATRSSSSGDHSAGGGSGWRGPGGAPLLPSALGAAGLVPFVWYGLQHDKPGTPAAPAFDGAVASWAARAGLPLVASLTASSQADVRRRFVGYGGVILSFLGAVHWGLALASPAPKPRTWLYAVMPSLWAWAALLEDRRARLLFLRERFGEREQTDR
jgi:hypothetical protein